MVQKNRRTGTSGRVTPSSTGRTTPSGTGSPTRTQHKPIVRIVAALAILMLVVSLATGIIAIVTG
ncbi:MAG: hypothetical protein OEW42_20505 [Acidimicrobiia bacterium]|nr:hypothetical protein [Acidimicrobiia bacterium]MDH5238513.1 hypothetical protein [Acidimicrobiia bacterium]